MNTLIQKISLSTGGLYPGGLISGIIYSLANEWAYNRGGGGGLIPGGFKVAFYGMETDNFITGNFPSKYAKI